MNSLQLYQHLLDQIEHKSQLVDCYKQLVNLRDQRIAQQNSQIERLEKLVSKACDALELAKKNLAVSVNLSECVFNPKNIHN